MESYLVNHEAQFRLGVFLSILVSVCVLEVFFPKRKLNYKRIVRWPNNIGIVILNTLALRFVIPLSAVGTALYAETHSLGLFNQLQWPFWLVSISSVIFLDLVIYTQHVVFHRVPILWRLHRMHHADRDYDFTLGSRFHPIEIVLSMLIKVAIVFSFGIPVVSVILFEMILNGMAMFNHGNFRIPFKLDALLRLILVTPDMHRVHHSDIPAETHSNFGFNLSCWDRLFKTYISQPQKGHKEMTIGLPIFKDSKYLKLPYMLKIPFE